MKKVKKISKYQKLCVKSENKGKIKPCCKKLKRINSQQKIVIFKEQIEQNALQA